LPDLCELARLLGLITLRKRDRFRLQGRVPFVPCRDSQRT